MRLCAAISRRSRRRRGRCGVLAARLGGSWSRRGRRARPAADHLRRRSTRDGARAGRDRRRRRPTRRAEHDCPGVGKPSSTSGDMNTHEQFILGQLYTSRWQHEGYTVDLDPNIGAPSVADAGAEATARSTLPRVPGRLEQLRSRSLERRFQTLAAAYARRDSVRAPARPGAARRRRRSATRRRRGDAPVRAREPRALARRSARGPADHLRRAAEFQASSDGLPRLEHGYGFEPGYVQHDRDRRSSTGARTAATSRPPTSDHRSSSWRPRLRAARRPQARLRLRQRRAGRPPKPCSRPRARRSSQTIDQIDALLTPQRDARAERRGRARSRPGQDRVPVPAGNGIIPPRATRRCRPPRRDHSPATSTGRGRRRLAVAVEPNPPLEPKPPGRARSRRARRPRPRPACDTAISTSCAIRSPASSRTGLVAVGVQQQHLQLAAVAGVDQPGRVDERDPVPSGQPGARQHQPGLPLRDLDGDRRCARSARSPGPSVTASSAYRSRPASPRVGARGQHRARVEPRTRSVSGAAHATWRPARALPRRVGAARVRLRSAPRPARAGAR